MCAHSTPLDSHDGTKRPGKAHSIHVAPHGSAGRTTGSLLISSPPTREQSGFPARLPLALASPPPRSPTPSPLSLPCPFLSRRSLPPSAPISPPARPAVAPLLPPPGGPRHRRRASLRPGEPLPRRRRRPAALSPPTRGRLLSLAAKRLQELVLRPPSDEPLRLPPSLLSCRSLRSAELTNCHLPEDAGSGGGEIYFPHLAELTLRLSRASSSAALHGLLACCPELASLSLDRVFGCRTLRVRSQSLRSLTVSVSLTWRHGLEGAEELEHLVEDAPAWRGCSRTASTGAHG
ncbi:hypothetical protein GQ55_6G179900 [Panicum hallii var. hallii]|uniref:F-box/LRR-repeat protein 15/At3g58940/PEG3-like LRR domain-containing protein n=1 Tax=Panicum hallii var. hallii TaxID=1504633 RepID=A0A2T7D710_9POAL|nr:hypothetical protein GQ55_6G179900 [Panicum hallii var. hallii]